MWDCSFKSYFIETTGARGLFPEELQALLKNKLIYESLPADSLCEPSAVELFGLKLTLCLGVDSDCTNLLMLKHFELPL